MLTFLENTANATDVLQYCKKYMLINVKAVNFSVFTRGNTYKPKLRFLATKIRTGKCSHFNDLCAVASFIHLTNCTFNYLNAVKAQYKKKLMIKSCYKK